MRTAIAGFVLLLASACSGGATDGPTTILEVDTFPEQAVDVHLSESAVRQIINSEIAAPEYNSDPPTSGAHSAKAAACGILRQPVPDAYQLHDLAIGVIVFQYAPSLEAVDVERIEELARSFEDRIIVAPRPGMDAPVIATAWTTMMRLSAVDEELLRAFYDQYVGSGRETGECPFDVDEGL
ncbi:MAG: DUF3105 domain-containing protein [Acidimicrobiia bacterium]|nr:DUF3105 domain-containing protein [Acidimicrobiia bacterium]